MLKNEMKYIEEILFELEYPDSDKAAQINFELQFSHIYKAWEKAIFSNKAENSLVRYFHYHLDVISTISSTLSDFQNPEKYLLPQNGLLALIDHLRKYYCNYFNEDAIAPVVYHQRLVLQLAGKICVIKKMLQSGSMSASLMACLSKWFILMSEDIGTVRFSFRSLHYFECITDQLSNLNGFSTDAETSLVAVLIRSNFNNLSFLVCFQDSIRHASKYLGDKSARLDYLIEQKALIMSFPEVTNRAYDSAWPSIKTMIGDWLDEEVLLAEKYLSNKREVTVPKIPLEMSVAHLSCLVRLLYEESVFATQNLQFIFKSIAGHYQSKRQAVISPGSLSKEFYSIDQHTAARVRDLLQRMVQRINRNYFPMVVAINATILSYLSIR